MTKGELAEQKWIPTELRRLSDNWKEGPFFEKNAIFMSDPRARRAIKAVLLKRLLPPAQEYLATTRYQFAGPFPPRIAEEWKVYACLGCALVLEDPINPNHPETFPPWHARLEMECSLRGLFLRDYLSFTAPVRFELANLVELVRNTSGHGIPTQMTLASDASAESYFHFVFESGAGTGWSDDWSLNSAAIVNKLRRYVSFIECAVDLYQDCNNARRLGALISAINAALGSQGQ